MIVAGFIHHDHILLTSIKTCAHHDDIAVPYVPVASSTSGKQYENAGESSVRGGVDISSANEIVPSHAGVAMHIRV
jgi:hypothetical protein